MVKPDPPSLKILVTIPHSMPPQKGTRASAAVNPSKTLSRDIRGRAELQKMDNLMDALASTCPMTTRGELSRLAKAFDMLEVTCQRGQKEC